jgi:hypothetical protein
MKTLSLIALATLVAFSFTMSPACAADAEGRIRHVVCFKFKEGTTPEQIKQVEQDFAALKGKIPQIAAFEWGTNCSPEKHDKGFTHCFLLTFNSAADRDAYLPHPAHKAFAKSLGGLIADVFVVDYAAQQ